MSKKFWIVTVAALVATIAVGTWGSGIALAQGSPTEPSFLDRVKIARRGLGMVMSIGTDSFIAERPNGDSHKIQVNEETQFVTTDGAPASMGDLEVGKWVVVIPTRTEGEELLAKKVFILPEGFDPGQFAGMRGLVTSIDLVANQFTLEARDGSVNTIDVDEQTRFFGQADALEDLEAEMGTWVLTQQEDDGSLLARAIRTGELRTQFMVHKYIGRIVSVDQDRFTILTRNEQELSFFVNEETRFRSRDGLIEGLNDLEPEMVAVVAAREEDETLTAVAVLAGTLDQLQEFEARAMGRVLSVEQSRFTIKTRSGEEIVVQVTGNTVFRSRGGRIDELSDLGVGMIVLVGGKELGNGNLQADVVLVGIRR